MTLARQIADDLQSRIRSGAALELTLAALSRRHGVSFTPVRAAVDRLIAEGYLEKRSNGQLQVCSPLPCGRRAKARSNDPPKAQDSWEALLKRDLIRRSLRGQAEYLREEATAEQFDVGRTAIRQAFGRLAGAGLLEHVPRCGWRVRSLSTTDLAAYLQIREALELKALDLAQPRLQAADLERMLRGNPPPLPGETPRLDNQLHAYLIEKSDNRYLRDFFERHGVYYTTLLDHAAPAAQMVAEMAGQHREILTALLAQDWRRARRALAHHIRSQQPVIETLLVRLQATT